MASWELRRASRATILVFFAAGMLFAAWASRVPTIRDLLEVSPAQMGLIVLAASSSSTIALPLTGWIVQRWGIRPTLRVTVTVGVAGVIAASLAASAGSQLGVVAMLFVGLGALSSWDVAINVHGGRVEKALGRAIMPVYHAGYSAGTIFGALTGWLMELGHVPLHVHIPLATAAVFLCGFLPVSAFLPDELVERHGGRSGSTLWAWRERRTLAIGLVVFAFGLTEGSANDWLSLAVVDGLDQSNAVGTAGFALFVTFMTVMRIVGTGLLDRFGRVAVLRATALLAIAGLVLFVFADSLLLALVGVALWAIGGALGFPVGMSAASDDPIKAAARISVVSTVGYLAFLAGPGLLGLLAEFTGYRNALGYVLLPLLLSLLLVRATAPLRTGSASVKA